ncbi:putative integral membrane protein [Arthrobacter sp. UYEF3]
MPTDVTRAGMIWVAVSAGLVLLVLLIIFILQNQDRVTVYYFGAAGELSLGMALFIAAVAGGILVAIAGAARILQLRKQRRHPPAGPPAAPANGTLPGPATTGRHEPTPGQ